MMPVGVDSSFAMALPFVRRCAGGGQPIRPRTGVVLAGEAVLSSESRGGRGAGERRNWVCLGLFFSPQRVSIWS